MLQEMRDRNPGDWETHLALGEALEAAEQYTEALAVCDATPERDRDQIELLLLRARCTIGLKQFQQARESLEHVLTLQPLNAQAETLLRAVAALQGKGNNSSVRTPIDPVPIPAELQPHLAVSHELTPAEREFDGVELLRVTGFYYQKGTQRKRTLYHTFVVNSSTGVEDASTLTTTFDPFSERVYVNKLNVYDSAGNLVGAGNIEDYYVLDADDDEGATHAQTLHIPVPNLKPGHVVEYVMTKEESGADEFGFEQIALSSSNPVKVSAVFVTGNLAEIAYAATQGSALELNANSVAWVLNSPAVLQWETLQRPLEFFLPMVIVCDKGHSWESLSRDYLEQVAEVFALDTEIAALAHAIADQHPTAVAKIQALAGYVQKECTYKALEFGVRARKPNPARMTRDNGYGDCKDHSVLLVQLLRAVDIPAHPTLVRSDGPLAFGFPSLDQFDHMIVYVEANAELPQGLFVDGTQKDTSPFVPITPGLSGKQALVLDAKSPRLETMPNYAARAAEINIVRDVTVSMHADGNGANLEVAEVWEFNHFISSGMRSVLRSVGSRDRLQVMSELIGGKSRLQFRNLQIESLDDPYQPLVLKMKYTVPNAMQADTNNSNGIRLIGKLPAPWEQYWLDVDFDDSRETPFEIKMPLAISAVTQVVADANLQLVSLEDPNSQGSSEFMDWSTVATPIPSGLRFDTQVSRAHGEFAPQQYEAYYNSSHQALRTAQRAIAVQVLK
jgi:hypothetical protein